MNFRSLLKTVIILFILQTVNSLIFNAAEPRNLQRETTSQQFPYFMERDDTLNKVFQTISFSVVVLTNFINPIDISPMFAISLAKLLQYIGYTDLSLPNSVIERLELTPNPASFLLSFNMPGDLKENFVEQGVSGEATSTKLYANYSVNQWNLLVTIFAILIVRGMIYIIEAATRKALKKKTSIIMKKLRTITSWSLLFVVFFSSYDYMIFFAIIEFKSFSLDSFFAVMSFILCLLVTLIAVYVLAKLILACKALTEKEIQQKTPKLEDSTSSPKKSYKPYKIIFNPYKNDTLLQQSYFLLHLARIIICSAITAFFSEYPLIQMPWFIILNLTMIHIIFDSKPIRHKFTMIIVIVFEVSILIVNFCCISLVFCNKFSTDECAAQNEIGYSILVIKAAIDISSHVFVYAHFGLTVKSVCDKAKLLATDQKLTKENVWKILAESSDLGTEEKDIPDSLSLGNKLSNKKFRKNGFRPRIVIRYSETGSNLLSTENQAPESPNKLQKEPSSASAEADEGTASPVSLHILSPGQSPLLPGNSSITSIVDDMPQSRNSRFQRKMFFGQKSTKGSQWGLQPRRRNGTIIEEPSNFEDNKVSETNQKSPRKHNSSSSEINSENDQNSGTANQVFVEEVHKMFKPIVKRRFNRDTLKVETIPSSIGNFSNKISTKGTQDFEESSLSGSATLSHEAGGVETPKSLLQNTTFEILSQNRATESQPDLIIQTRERNKSMRRRILNRNFIASQTSQILSDSNEKNESA